MKQLARIVIFFLLTFVLFSCCTFALERFDIITTEQMKQMLDWREAGEIDFVLVNALDEIIFRHTSIPGSVSLPWYKADQLQSRLGEDKNKLIITY